MPNISDCVSNVANIVTVYQGWVYFGGTRVYRINWMVR